MGKAQILGVDVDIIDKDQLTDRIRESVRQKKKDLYPYVNIHAINIAQEDRQFQELLNSAWTVYCDGEGVRLGARILGWRLPPRIVLTYYLWELLEAFQKEEMSVYFLGGREEVLKDAVANVRERFPRLKIAGSHYGYFQKTGTESDTVVESVARSGADVLFVGFGMPLQEHWISQNIDRLEVHAILPCGSMIEYAGGAKRNTPAWMADHGMEWLFRLMQEPGRLWSRYLIGNPLFLLRVLGQRVRGNRG
jgi:N-acetylglucosaminyldiphosphoundecaprenol N-acetyl-beta-D-mannosaminyltransferase